MLSAEVLNMHRLKCIMWYTTKVNSINVLQQQHFVPKLTK